MANPEHLEILKQGVRIWNEWREDNLKEHLIKKEMKIALLYFPLEWMMK